MNLVGNCAWCAGMFVCSAITDCIGVSFKQQVRLSYFIFDTCFVGFGLLVLFGISKLVSSEDLTDIFSYFATCPSDAGFSCLGVFSIYRISLALVVLHLFILLFLLLRNGCSRVFNEEVWLFKILILVASVIGFFFIGNEFFAGYSKVATVVSLFFLLFQIVMMIDLFYMWGVNWIKRYDEGANCFLYLLLIFTIAMYGGSAYFIISSYSAFGGCSTGVVATSVNVFFIVLAIVLILLRTNPDGSLLCSAAVSLVSSYLVWSGLSNMEDATCNTFTNNEAVGVANLIIGILIIIVSLTYVSVGSSEETSGQMHAGGVNVAQAVLAEPKGEEEEQRARLDEENKAPRKRDPNDLSAYKTNTYINYHIILLFASCYVAMLLTDWGSSSAMKQSAFINYQKGDLSMWIKIGTSWIAILVYIWTLLAPKIFPDRDFS